ncbi:MAG: Asp-tRNA(Asn)/Glu-tRNA(Gln) amidotransferase subunit GatB, partial [Desulfovibrionaceae bacterium]
MPRYEAVIGLEVHAQLKTESKIFCSCSTAFGAEPNTNVCPVCSGMPGVLPVMNEKVLRFAAMMGLAVHCTINRTSVFARKNYFYPDLPKAYQISQYEQPMCEHGYVDIVTSAGAKRVGITRIHIEEDAGKSIHSPGENKSFVDLNRTGVPLIEIVSEPDMRSAEEAVAYLKNLRAILLYLGICDGNLEEGSFRCDANVSIRPVGQAEFGTRAELKNMNSFRNIQKAIDYEIQRQIDLVEDGGVVVQQTRLFNPDKGVTAPMREKEEAHDYRYYPDPDLVPMVVEDAWVEGLRAGLPELPAARKARFAADFGLSETDAEVLTAERAVADFFEGAAQAFAGDPKKVANWVMGDVLRVMHETGLTPETAQGTPAAFAALVALVEEGKISAKSGHVIFLEVWRDG